MSNKLVACCEYIGCICFSSYCIYSYEDDKVLELIKVHQSNDECPDEISDMLTFVRHCTWKEYEAFEHKFECYVMV